MPPRFPAFAVAAALITATSPHHAAAVQPAERAPSVASSENVAEITQQWLDDGLHRLLLERIRQIPDPDPVDYALTALGLRIVQVSRPDVAELVRHEIDAWNAAGDAELAAEASRRLLRLDPDDTAALLRVLDRAARQRQTVEDRLAFYDRVLNDAPERIHPSVRSRLALDAALLAREAGDEQRFVDLLTEATTLDVTNKQAASLFATVFLDRVESPLERIELLANIVLADPLDPEALGNLADAFFGAAAYRQANRFLTLRSVVLTRLGQSPTIDDVAARITLLWQTAGVEAAVDYLTSLQRRGDQIYEAERNRLISQEIDPGERVAQIMAVQLESARLVLLKSLGDDAVGIAFQTERQRELVDGEPTPVNLRFIDAQPIEGAEPPPFPTERAYRRSLAAIQQSLDQLDDPALLEAGLTEDDLVQREFTLRAQRVWARLFAELDLDQATAELERLVRDAEAGGNPLGEEAEQRFSAWIDSLRGGADSSVTLSRIAEGGDATARWALARHHERNDDRRAAATNYILLAREHPASILAAAAIHRAETILGEPIAPSDAARRIERYGDSFARWIDRFTRDPNEALNVQVIPEEDMVEPLDRPRIVVSVTNAGPAPLAVGTGRTAPATLLLSPRITMGGQEMPADLVEPLTRAIAAQQRISEDDARVIAVTQTRQLSRRMLEVVDVQRRIRLDPRESITIRLWPGRGFSGIWLDQDVTRRATVRYRATLGISGADGDVQASPYSVYAESPTITRTSYTDPELRPLDLAAARGVDRLREIMRAVTAMLANANRTNAERVAAAREEAVRQFADNAPSFSDDEALFAFMRLAEAGLMRSDIPSTQPILDRVLAIDPVPAEALAAMLVILPRASDDGLFERALSHDNEDLRRLASLIRSAIQGAERARDAATRSGGEPVSK